MPVRKGTGLFLTPFESVERDFNFLLGYIYMNWVVVAMEISKLILTSPWLCLKLCLWGDSNYENEDCGCLPLKMPLVISSPHLLN